jgi:hypothetical protein
MRNIPAGPLDVRHLLTDEHRAFLASVTSRPATGLSMMADDPDDGDDDDPDDDDPLELELTDKIKVGNRTMTVGELQRIAATEKKQGKRSGQTAVLKALGFDTLDDAKAAIARLPKGKTEDDKPTGDDEATRRAEQRELEAAERERKSALKERRADLRGILRDHGVSRDDLDDAQAMLDRLVDDDYDEDDLEDAVETLKTKRAAKPLFEPLSDEEQEEREAPRRRAARLPTGGPRERRQKPPAKPFGAGGLERARQKGWVKD